MRMAAVARTRTSPGLASAIRSPRPPACAVTSAPVARSGIPRPLAPTVLSLAPVLMSPPVLDRPVDPPDDERRHDASIERSGHALHVPACYARAATHSCVADTTRLRVDTAGRAGTAGARWGLP